jgi:hypothetical protein
MFDNTTIGEWSPSQLVEFVRINLLNRELEPIRRDVSKRIPVPGEYTEGQVITWNGANNKWLAKTPAGGAGGYSLIQDEGTPLTARTTINFVGAGVTATDSGAVTTVTIPSSAGYNLVQDEGTPLTARTTINFVGSGVTATDSGALTTVTIPTQQAYTTVEEEGTPLTQRTNINFVGSTVTAVDSGGKTVVTIAPNYQVIEDEGTPLTARTNMNFVGSGVTATDAGGKTVVTIPGGSGYNLVQDEGTPLTARTTINFIGAGVTAADSGSVTNVTIPGGAGSFSMTEVEVYFGAGTTWAAWASLYSSWSALSAAVTSWAVAAGTLKGTFSENFEILDSAVTASSKILVGESGNTATNRAGGDDYEWDGVHYAATPATGKFQLRANANPGPIVGNRKLVYTVA